MTTTNALDLVAAAELAVSLVTDQPPTQMHRSALRGKRLLSHLTAWDRTANAGEGGIRLLIRADGQYIPLAQALLPTRAAATALQAEVDALLADRGPLGSWPAPISTT